MDPSGGRVAAPAARRSDQRTPGELHQNRHTPKNRLAARTSARTGLREKPGESRRSGVERARVEALVLITWTECRSSTRTPFAVAHLDGRLSTIATTLEDAESDIR
jgi:hypothetical protein